MDFGLSEEQVMLKTSARDFLENECPKQLVREMMEDDRGYSLDLWKKMADLGWLGLVFPEEYDGVGSGFLDLAVLLEEMGRALVPGPFIPTVVLAGRPILAAGTPEQKRRFLPGIARGESILTLALTEADGRLDAGGINTAARLDKDDFIIEGTKLFVPDAHVADYFLCVARTAAGNTPEEGITLILVDARTPGVHIEVLNTLAGEKLCEVIFRHVIVPKENVLGEIDNGWPIVESILVEASVAECCWIAGGARWALEDNIQYAKDRIQFGRPIGSFQIIQHKCVDMTGEVEGATSIAYYAAWAVSESDPEAPLAASVAKAYCSDIYKHVTAEGIQIHGGVGFTWDHDMHLYYRRAKSSEVAWGDSHYHRELVARTLDAL